MEYEWLNFSPMHEYYGICSNLVPIPSPFPVQLCPLLGTVENYSVPFHPTFSRTIAGPLYKGAISHPVSLLSPASLINNIPLIPSTNSLAKYMSTPYITTISQVQPLQPPLIAPQRRSNPDFHFRDTFSTFQLIQNALKNQYRYLLHLSPSHLATLSDPEHPDVSHYAVNCETANGCANPPFNLGWPSGRKVIEWLWRMRELSWDDLERQNEEWRREQYNIKMFLEPRVTSTLPWIEKEHWKFDVVLDPRIVRQRSSRKGSKTTNSRTRSESLVSMYSGSAGDLDLQMLTTEGGEWCRDDASAAAICGRSTVGRDDIGDQNNRRSFSQPPAESPASETEDNRPEVEASTDNASPSNSPPHIDRTDERPTTLSSKHRIILASVIALIQKIKPKKSVETEATHENE